MNKICTQPIGVIEGFFGRSWSWEDRKNYIHFLQQHAYDFYIYAPKSDRNLRTQWMQDWDSATKASLHQLRANYRAANVAFGIGLSPHEIYLDSARNQRQPFAKRIAQINELEPDIFCILFDDMRGDIPGLAQIQIDFAHQAAEQCNAKKIIFCPTYYSFDPVLEKVFGQMPPGYWQTFAQKLDRHIDIFWSGEKVCSMDYSATHLAEISELIGRQPFLWDNYPVNDGAVKSNLLRLRAFSKSHAQLAGKLAGHAVNPMNQAWLSQFALASLTQAYQHPNQYNPEATFATVCTQLGGNELGRQIHQDIELLQDKGLKNLTPAEQQKLRDHYCRFSGNPFAQEIIAWLDGEYIFDPACLTE